MVEIGHEVVGKRAEIPGIIDDECGYFFDPAYTIDENGRIRITEISLCKKERLEIHGKEIGGVKDVKTLSETI